MIRLTIPAHDMQTLEQERFQHPEPSGSTKNGSSIFDEDGFVLPRCGAPPLCDGRDRALSSVSRRRTRGAGTVQSASPCGRVGCPCDPCAGSVYAHAAPHGAGSRGPD